jgi:hypothetical protein
MQYSTNSNEAMRSIIRSKATLIGQYRQARLELEQRYNTLTHTGFELKRLKIQRDAAVEERADLQKKIDLGLSDRATRTRLALLDVDIEEFDHNLRSTCELVQDVRREYAVCQQEIERITNAAGTDLGQLPDDVFQSGMTTEYRRNLIRHVAARTLQPITGLPWEAIETVLEIPEADRPEYIALLHETQQQFVNSFQPSNKSFANEHFNTETP